MTVFRKIALSRRFGKAIYIISAVLTFAMCSLIVMSPVSIPVCICLKLLSIPVIFYLYTTLVRKTEIYFYLNLGITRNEYYVIPFIMEFLGFILLVIITGKIGYAIH